MEELAEDEAFPDQALAAAVASKCYYHLEVYDEALRLALSAGKYFDITEDSEYVHKIVSKCIDEYIRQKRGQQGVSDDDDDDNDDGEIDEEFGDSDRAAKREAGEALKNPAVDPSVMEIVERMYQNCNATGHFRQALGVAFEAQDLEKIDEILSASGDSQAMLGFGFKLCQTSDITRAFRTSVLQILARKYRSLEEPDYINVCQCLQYLNDAKGVADILLDLIAQGDDLKKVQALQVAFVLVENQNQQFMREVTSHMRLPGDEPEESPKAASSGAAAEPSADTADPAEGSRKRKMDGEEEDGPELKRTNMQASPREVPTIPEDQVEGILQLRKVLDGSETVDAQLAFLCRNNMTDLLLLERIRDSTTKVRNYSVLHNATVVAHSYMNAGTTSDVFLRNNMEWLRSATNWARFTAVAALGVVHKGNLKNSMSVLKAYLPSADGAPNGDPGQKYAEGGALFALGLIHANKYDREKILYLEEALQRATTTTNPTHIHGACLGLGFAGMSAGEMRHMTLLQDTLYQHEDAVAGEAAALTMGLLNMGAGSTTPASRKALEVMMPHAHATDHEKIIRGHAIGMALMMYQQEEQALTLIHQLIRDKDPILRYGGVFTIGLAFCGTANNKQIARLLHIAVSDVSNDVKRAAVTMLGFVMLKNPDKVPQLVSLLSHSYSPHIRYGAAMAVGIACSGTSLPSALEILNPLLKDSVDYVRSAAHICKAMVIMQDAAKYKPFEDSLNEIITGKASNATTLVMSSAVLASGVLNAGGRNVTISLVSDAGHRMQAAIAGMTLWLQHWYWYPYYTALSLAFTPTVLIGFNKDLKIPSNFTMESKARPSQFAYPEPLKEKTEDKKERITTVTLSTTAAAQARKRKKEAVSGKKDDADKSAVDDDEPSKPAAETEGGSKPAKATDKDAAEGSKVDADADTDKESEKKAKAKEPTSFLVENPGRVTQRQRATMELVEEGQRYKPILTGVRSGMVMLVDTTPGEEETFVDFSKPLNPKTKAPTEEDEPKPPKPFIWRPK